MDHQLFVIFLNLRKSTIEVRDGLPHLFNIYTQDLHGIENQKTLVYQYADDFLPISFDKYFDLAEANLQKKVEDFSRKC